jgi:hypothetical protein
MYTDKAQRAFGGKMPRGHLLFTEIIVVSALVSCNFEHEDFISSK